MTHSRAFTLIELAVVLLVLSLILGGGLTYATRKTQQNQRDETLARIAVIEDAILAYRRATDNLPCPAVAAGINPSNSAFGVADTAGTCPNVTGLAGGGGNAVSGDLPVRTLKLSDEYAFDGWGYRFTYVVDKRATLAGTTFSVAYKITNSTIGDIVVNNAAGTALTSKAVALIYSHGSDGRGAYTVAGTQKTLSSGNADENNNCNCNGAAVNNVFVMKMPTESTSSVLDNFDDIVRYKMRWHLYSLAPAESPAVKAF